MATRSTDDTRLAWAAGLFEGEGSISLTSRPSEPWRYLRGRLSLAMTDLDVVLRFCATLGISRPPRPVPTRLGRKTLWAVDISARDEVERVLVALLPWLGERRRGKAQRVLDYYKHNPKGGAR